MIIDDAVVAWLETQKSVTDLLSDPEAIFTDKAPDGTSRSFIKVELDRNSIDHTMAGMQQLSEADITLHCEGSTKAAGSEIAEKIRLLFIDGYQGLMGLLNIRHGTIIDISDRYSNTFAGKNEGLPARLVSLRLHYYMPTT